jgi:hypothetical protein
MHEATNWHDAVWPKPRRAGVIPFRRPPYKDEARAQVDCYQRLKQEMEELKKHEDELTFFRKELRAKRGTFHFLSANWWLNWLYDISSGYGQSIIKPSIGLSIVCGLSTVFFATATVHRGKPLPWVDAFSLSIANMFSFLSLRKNFVAATLITEFSRPLFLVSAAESILAAVLLFLLALGLRNRFRIK